MPTVRVKAAPRKVAVAAPRRVMVTRTPKTLFDPDDWRYSQFNTWGWETLLEHEPRECAFCSALEPRNHEFVCIGAGSHLVPYQYCCDDCYNKFRNAGKLVGCAQCGTTITREDVVLYWGRYDERRPTSTMCKDCAEERLIPCGNCGHTVATSYHVRMSDGNDIRMCVRCASDGVWRCNYCNIRQHADVPQTIVHRRGEALTCCPTCREESFIQCPQCERWVVRDGGDYVDDEGICLRCSSARFEALEARALACDTHLNNANPPNYYVRPTSCVPDRFMVEDARKPTPETRRWIQGFYSNQRLHYRLHWPMSRFNWRVKPIYVQDDTSANAFDSVMRSTYDVLGVMLRAFNDGNFPDWKEWFTELQKTKLIEFREKIGEFSTDELRTNKNSRGAKTTRRIRKLLDKYGNAYLDVWQKLKELEFKYNSYTLPPIVASQWGNLMYGYFRAENFNNYDIASAYEKYATNINKGKEYTMLFGFEEYMPDGTLTLDRVHTLNVQVKSCQRKEFKFRYAAGFACMVNNPFNLALIIDPNDNNKIVARAVVRYFATPGIVQSGKGHDLENQWHMLDRLFCSFGDPLRNRFVNELAMFLTECVPNTMVSHSVYPNQQSNSTQINTPAFTLTTGVRHPKIGTCSLYAPLYVIPHTGHWDSGHRPYYYHDSGGTNNAYSCDDTKLVWARDIIGSRHVCVYHPRKKTAPRSNSL